MTNKRILTLISLLLFLFLLAGCDWPWTINKSPEIKSAPVETATVGVDYTYNVVATDPDGDVLTYSLIDEPTGMLIGGTSGKITWTPDVVGDFPVTVVASDGKLSDTQDFTITVSEFVKELDHILVLPETMELFVGESGFITSVTAYYNDGTDNLPDNWTYGLNPIGIVDVNVITGEVTIEAIGETTITISYTEGDITKTDTIEVTVEVFPYSFTHTQPVSVLKVGDLVTTVAEDGDWMVWTFDFPVEEFTGEGNLNVGLIIATDGEGQGPAFQIHNNDGVDHGFGFGTWLYSEYDNGWHSGTGGNNQEVSGIAWIEAIGQRNTPWEGLVSGDGVMEIRIKKSELGNTFHWAASPTVGSGFWDPIYNVAMQIPTAFNWSTSIVDMDIPNFIAR